MTVGDTGQTPVVAEQGFVGREAELAQFAGVLRELVEAGGSRRARWPVRRLAGADDLSCRSRVVLVHGPGGTGKSWLLRQFQAMARASVSTAWLDWAPVAAWGSGLGGEAAEAGIVKVLDSVQWAVTRAFTDDDEFAAGRVAFEFREYRGGADRMPEYVARAVEVAERAGRAGFPCSRPDAATLMRKLESAGLATLAGSRQAPDPGSDKAQEAAGPLSAAIAQAVTKRAPGELPPREYALVTDPATELTRRFAEAVSELTARKPLVIFVDDGELLSDRAWQWLRLVMMQTGRRVAWVAAGRFAGAPGDDAVGQVGGFVGDLGDRLMTVSPAPFDCSMISAYFKHRSNARDCAREEIDLITRYTAGQPLAVSLSATLLDDGATATQVCAATGDDPDGPASARLIRQYVARAQAGGGDAAKVVALALAYGTPADSDLLAALWGDSYPIDIFEALASRHDFLLPASLRLHDDVRDLLRAELLSPERRVLAREPSERALRQSLARLNSARGRWPTLDQQLGQPEFTGALLRAIWYSTWISNQDGLDLLTGVFPVLMTASSRIAEIALAITHQFAGTFTPDQKRRLEQVTQEPPDLSGESAHGGLIGQPGDRQAAVRILAARHQAAGNRHEEAIASLRQAATATTSDLLRTVIGRQALAIAAELMRAGPGGYAVHSDTSLAAAELAAGLLPGTVSAWWCYGPALHYAGRAEEAVAAHCTALKLHPDDAVTYSNLGAALRLLGRFTEALAAHDRALTIAPDNVHICSGRIAALGALGRFDEALAAADQALALDPGHSRTYTYQGVVLAATGQYRSALAAFERAIALDPDNAAAHANNGVALAATGDLDSALAEFGAARRLDPSDAGEASAWTGAIMWHRRDDTAAREHFALVTDHLARHAPFHKAELAAIASCALGEPDRAADLLLGAVSLRSAADEARPRAIYDLLAEPLLPGIDRLRTVIDEMALSR